MDPFLLVFLWEVQIKELLLEVYPDFYDCMQIYGTLSLGPTVPTYLYW